MNMNENTEKINGKCIHQFNGWRNKQGHRIQSRIYPVTGEVLERIIGMGNVYIERIK